MADSCEHPTLLHDEEDNDDDENDEMNHLFQGRETLHLCPGENWLRLVVSTGGLDLLADTQDTTANASVPNPSIVSLEEVGKIMEEWPTSDCFICIDVDGGVMTVKDMRPPLAEDGEDDGDDQLFAVCLQKRLADKGLVDTDTLDYDDDDAYDALEELPRRQMKVFHNGDRLCTVAAKQRSNCTQNTARPGGGDEQVMAGTLGLVLTYRCYKGAHDRYGTQNNNTQVSQLTTLSASGPAATLTRTNTLIALETQDSHPLQLDDDDETATKSSSAGPPQSIATSSSRPCTQDGPHVEVIDVDADEAGIDNYGGQETQFDDEDDDDFDEDEFGEPTQAYPLMTQSPERNDGGGGDDDAKPRAENRESTNKGTEPLHAIDEAIEIDDDDEAQTNDKKEQVSEPEGKTPLPEEATSSDEDAAQSNGTDDACNKAESKVQEAKNGSPLPGDEHMEGNTDESERGPLENIDGADVKKQAQVDAASGNEKAMPFTPVEKEQGANQDPLEADTSQILQIEPNEQVEREVDGTGKNSQDGIAEDAPLKDPPTDEGRISTPTDPPEDSRAVDETSYAENDDDDETVLEEEEALVSDSLNTSMLDEATQLLPDSCTGDTNTLLVDRVPNGERVLPDENEEDEILQKENSKEPVHLEVPLPSTAVAKDDGSESTGLTEVDENIQTGRNVPIAKADPPASKVNDEDAIEDPENASLLSPFSPMARLAPRGRDLRQQSEDSVPTKDEASGGQSKTTLDPKGEGVQTEEVSNDEQVASVVAPASAPAVTPKKGDSLNVPGPSATIDPPEECEQEALPSRQSARKRKVSGNSPGEQSVSHTRRSSPRSNGKATGGNSQGESQVSTASIASRKRQKKESLNIRVVVTGVVLTAKERAKIKAIGGDILDKVEDAASATHVIVTDGKERLRRTPKLMIALCSTSNVVSMKWLNDSSKKRKALSTRGYLVLHDKEAENIYSFSMRETLRNGDRLRKQGKTLLDGRRVFVCKGVAGNKAPKEIELKMIINAAGGRWVSSLSQLNGVASETAIIITSDPPPKSQLSNKEVVKAINNGISHFSTSWLFNSLLCQELKDG